MLNSLKPHTAYMIRIAAINQLDRSIFTEPVVVKTQEEGNVLLVNCLNIIFVCTHYITKSVGDAFGTLFEYKLRRFPSGVYVSAIV